MFLYIVESKLRLCTHAYLHITNMAGAKSSCKTGVAHIVVGIKYLRMKTLLFTPRTLNKKL